MRTRLYIKQHFSHPPMNQSVAIFHKTDGLNLLYLSLTVFIERRHARNNVFGLAVIGIGSHDGNDAVRRLTAWQNPIDSRNKNNCSYAAAPRPTFNLQLTK